jgi:geranylgeranyl reductase family protein
MPVASAEDIWDAIVVGAGPAGCAAAYDLAAAGRRVLLVDRAEFPRAKACAGGLTMKAVKALRYPIDPVVRRWVRSIALEESSTHAVTVGRKVAVCAMTVREELDSFCLGKTIARGAAFRRIAALFAIEHNEDHGIEHVTLRLGNGGTLRARFVLGADGVHSRVRALTTDGSWFRTGFALEANVPYTQPGDGYELTFDFASVARGYGWLFPRDNHVNVGLYIESAEAAKLDRGALDRYIAARCGPARVYSRPVGQFLGLGAVGYRPASGTRVLLAGDAAGFVDPLTGEGIYGAIRSGQAAAAAMHAALGGGRKFRHSHVQGHKTTVTPGTPLANGFVAGTEALRRDLGVAEHAAARFYANPHRGFQLLRLPLMARGVLRAYSDGLPLAYLLRGVRVAGRFASH